ncbi:hypothetical protein C1645_827070, partial [Glomus cerebriforme]
MNIMNLNCHCYNCNVNNPANFFILQNNEDKQNLILLICKKIFEAIQNDQTSTEISYGRSTMKHKQLRNINEVNNCIDEEFGQLFKNRVLHKEMKKLSIGLLEISKEWYDSFTQHLQKVNNQKR